MIGPIAVYFDVRDHGKSMTITRKGWLRSFVVILNVTKAIVEDTTLGTFHTISLTDVRRIGFKKKGDSPCDFKLSPTQSSN